MFAINRDLALHRDPARRFLPWLIAMIVYLAGLSLAGMMSLSSVVDRWDTGLSGTLTVQVPAGDSAPATDKAVAAVVKALSSAPGVLSAKPLSLKETSALLEPWLGPDVMKDDLTGELPLPRLIDVRIRTDAAPDIAGLAALVKNAAPGATVDDHKKSLDRLITLAHAVELTAIAIVVLVVLAAIATVIFITRTGLAIHAAGIELLHLIGATDGYVARQFQRQALDLAVKGGSIGFALTAVTVYAIGSITGALGSNLLPNLSLTAAQWGALAGVPVAVAAIGMATAHITVVHALKELP